MAPPSFTVDGVRYTWPRLPLYDYGPENRRQMDAIRARIKAEHEAARAWREANPQPKPLSARFGSRCPICLDDWDVNETPVFSGCCCRVICKSCESCKSRTAGECPLCRVPAPKTDAEMVARIRCHAENEIPEAIAQLGEYHWYGLYGLEKSVDEAITLHERAVAGGNFRALLSLGYYYETKSVEPNKKKAAFCYQMAADRGDARAQLRLGKIAYDAGDFGEAVHLYGLAVAQGYTEAQVNLGFSYYKGQGVPQNIEEAKRLWQLAAAKGQMQAQKNLGDCAYNAGDFGEAARLFGLAAAQGHTQAQYHLGHCHETGQGVPQNTEEAKRLWQLAAAKGQMHAQHNLGDCAYNAGDFGEAARLFNLAAEQGHTQAQYVLSVCHIKGEGVPQNTEEAQRLLRLAAANGHQKAKELVALGLA